MYIIYIYILPGNILDYEENLRSRQQRDQMDIPMIIRRPILCRCLISADTPLHKHTKTNRETGQKCSKNWTSYQQRQNKNNAKQLTNSRPSHTRRARHSRSNIFNIHWNHQSDADWKHRGWNQDNA